MNQPSITDVVGLFVLIAAALFSSEVAAVVGPYMVIVVASAIGASFALSRRDRSTRASALLFFMRVCGLAVLVTGVASAGVAAYHPGLTERVLIAPLAFLIGLAGDSWPDIAAAAGRKVSAFVDVLIKLKGGGNG
jgi:hypothetical protein